MKMTWNNLLVVCIVLFTVSACANPEKKHFVGRRNLVFGYITNYRCESEFATFR